MAECYKCGVSDERERLFDAISNKGVVKICKNCAKENSLPIVQPVDLNKPERVNSVYERLSRMAHLDPEKHKKMILDKERDESVKRRAIEMKKRQGVTLKEVIDKNLEGKKIQPRVDLVDNFHWVLMRARRAEKLTQKQLAENIGESESAIKRAEEGIFLNNSDVLIRKLENYLCVRIRKGESPYYLEGSRFVKEDMSEDSFKKEIKERFEKETNFDYSTTQNLTISDLKEMKRKREEKALSDEEVDDILFRK